MLNRYAIGTDRLFDRLASHLEQELQAMRVPSIGLTLGRCRLGDHRYFTLELRQRDLLGQVRAALAKAVTDFWTLTWEPVWIRQHIAKTHTYCDAEEVDFLSGRAVQFLSVYRRPDAPLGRRTEISRRVREYLEEQAVLHVQGLMRFRLRQLEADRLHAVAHVMEEYWIEREYQ